jgi:hypothetical protein
MRIFIVLVALLLATAGGFAADQSTGKASGKSPKAGDVKKSTDQSIAKEKKTPTWPRPYQPTEEISVDSTVPFPTDI